MKSSDDAPSEVDGDNDESKTDQLDDGTKPKSLLKSLLGREREHERQIPYLHDSVSLGNVEKGLLGMRSSEPLAGSKELEEETRQKQDEVKRLPLLLRILSKGRALASINLPDTIKLKDDESTEGVVTKPDNDKDVDEILENAVRRLEDRAAIYSASEDVEAISCHLAPYVCRRISKLPPCRRAADGTWETADLAAVARNPSSNRFQVQDQNKRRRTSQDITQRQSSSMVADEFYESDDYDDSQALEREEDQASGKKRPSMPKRKRLVSSSTTEHNSTLLAAGEAEDSLEAFVTKTLSELALVVTQHLQEAKKDKDSPSPPEAATEKTAAADAASMEESILAQARVVTNLDGVIGSDLGSTVSSLFHHAAVLRHSQTASALCQAGQPQTPQLLERLAANCPAGIPCLVRGCLKVAEKAEFGTTKHKLAVQSIHSISKASGRERQRISTMLRLSESAPPLGSILKLQLELALDNGDSVDLACFLIRHLSRAPPVDLRPATRDRDERPGIKKNPSMEGELMGVSGATEASEKVKNPSASEPQEAAKSDHERPLAETKKPIGSLAVVLSDDGAKWLPRVRSCLEKGIDWAKNESVAPSRRGKECLLLRAYLWVLCTQEVSRETGNTPPSKLVEIGASFIGALEAMRKGGMEEDSMDDMHCLLLSCMILATTLQGLANSREHKVCVHRLFALAISARMKSFVGCLAYALQASVAEHSLRCFLLKYLGASTDDIARWQSRFPVAHLDIGNWCRENLDLAAVSESSLEPETVLDGPLVFIVALESSPSTLPRCRVESVLEALCLKPSGRQALSLLASEDTFLALTKGTCHLRDVCTEGTPLIPIVRPITLDMQACAFLKSSREEYEDLDQESAKFLLQLLYCFLFRDCARDSPFAFDPTTIPLKEAWLVCNRCDRIAPSIRKFLLDHIEDSAPEAMELARYTDCIRKSHLFLHQPSRAVDKDELKNKLRLFVSDKSTDSSGSLSQKTFLHAIVALSEKELICTTVCSVLTAPKSPQVFLTYRKICEDPLVVMKGALSDLWARPSLRHVMSFMVSILLQANSALISRAFRGDDLCLQELVAARDLLTVRCLVSSATANEAAGVDCRGTISLLRWILSSHKGLSTCLLRQGLPHRDLEWLVNHVPEVMLGSSEYADLLMDEGILNPVERLTVAESLVRMVVLYGHRYESQSQSIMQAALSHLVSGFFLVLGPSGVSVSALLPENDSKMDATQVSRKAAMAILQHLAGVRGFRRNLRSECAVALQKLHRMCKGEEIVGGLSVSVGVRQKNALREILEAVTRTMSSIGIGGI